MIGTAKYTEEFLDPNTGLRKWIGMELQYDTNLRSAHDVFVEIDKEVQAFANHKKQGSVVQKKEEKEIKVGDMYALIADCKSLDDINSFKKLVELQRDANLIEVWKLRRSQIDGSNEITLSEVERVRKKLEP